MMLFFFSSRRRHTRLTCDWSSDVCSSDLQPTVTIDLEGHGREDLGPDFDVSRTVGWFTTIFPVTVTFDAYPGDLGAALRQTKEQLRRVPRRGLSHGVLRYLAAGQVGRALSEM